MMKGFPLQLIRTKSILIQLGEDINLRLLKRLRLYQTHTTIPIIRIELLDLIIVDLSWQQEEFGPRGFLFLPHAVLEEFGHGGDDHGLFLHHRALMSGTSDEMEGGLEAFVVGRA